MTTMCAATIDRYGSGEVIEINRIARPVCGPDQVVVAVRAASVNPYDWHKLTGTPLLMRMTGGVRKPNFRLLGIDVAGVVESVGDNVDDLVAGDEVLGCAEGAFADYVAAERATLVKKPPNVSFEEAAAVPVGALTALQGLRDHGRLRSEQHVLVNGASGGVGTYAVQLAGILGAKVTGVCSTKNVDLIRSLGAEHVVDYTTDDFTKNVNEYDLILDCIGNRKIAHYKRCLSDTGAYIVVGAPKGRVLGPVPHMLRSLIAFKFGSQRAAIFMAQQTPGDLEFFRELLSSGTMRSVIDRVYPFENIAEAFNHLETGHAKGKIIVSISSESLLGR